MTERFETTTTVRRPRVVLMWAATGALSSLMLAGLVLRFTHGRSWRDVGVLARFPLFALGPIIAYLQRHPKIETLDVVATHEGLRLGKALVPHARLKTATVRREEDRTFVVLRGKNRLVPTIDVEVSGDEQAEQLCLALELDAKSTTAELSGFKPHKSTEWMMVALFVAGAIGALAGVVTQHRVLAIGAVAAMAILIPLLMWAREPKLVVGADGIVVKQGLAKREFVSHDDIERVEAVERDVVLTRKHGPAMTFTVGNTDPGRNAKQGSELKQQAESIVWRIEKARQAYRALAGEAPQAALALDRGGKTTSEWIEQLKRVGAGANATFRSVQLTREQLLRVVESTTASARERLAAAVALRVGLSEEEKPRIRVAAERCAQPALRERMVRVAFAPSEEELAAALDEGEDLRSEAASTSG